MSSQTVDDGGILNRYVSEETETAAVVTVGVQAFLLVAAFAAFLLMSPWLMPILILFLITAGYGWVRHQALTARALTFMMTASTIVILGLIAIFIFLEAVPTVRLMGVELFVPPETGWSVNQNNFWMVPMIWGPS
ncbi:MAG: hypothetical protein SXQ77_03130 [Halobacteria archaeon]|nr:hypothetical protein [Halobacteria archaeon]